MATTKTVVYKASDLSSLEDLKTTCEADEGHLGKIIKISPAVLEKKDGDKAVAVIYERVPLSTTLNIGELIFTEYTSALDAAKKASDLTKDGNTPVIPGDVESKATAFIKDKEVKFVVFRKKKTS